MLRVDSSDRRSHLVWLALPASIIFHLAVFAIVEGWTVPGPKPYGPSKVEFKVKAPAPKPPVEAAPREPVVKPKPLKKRTPKPPPKRTPRAPKPNTSKPAPKEPAAAPPRPVFGVSADSVAAGDSGVAVRVGNTLQKEMEEDYTPPEAVEALPPAPAPEPVRRALPAPVPSYELTRAPSFEHKIEPVYPALEREEGIEGTVKLEVLVDETGAVRKVRVLKAPTRALAKAALMALRESRLTPGFVGDRPVAVRQTVQYRFVLN